MKSICLILALSTVSLFTQADVSDCSPHQLLHCQVEFTDSKGKTAVIAKDAVKAIARESDLNSPDPQFACVSGRMMKLSSGYPGLTYEPAIRTYDENDYTFYYYLFANSGKGPLVNTGDDYQSQLLPNGDAKIYQYRNSKLTCWVTKN